MEDDLFESKATAMTQPFRLSIAVPLHNEEAVLPELLMRVRKVLSDIPAGPHEVVFVDDGSCDRTLEILLQAAAEDDQLIVVSLSRNFGHQAALTAALDYASGDAVVVMDGDLQDTPETIATFVDKFREGYDVVYAKRVQRKESWWLRLSYHLFYRLLARSCEVELPVDAGDFGLMSARVVDQLRQMREHHRYLRGLRAWVGFRQIGIDVPRQRRYAGNSKYSIMRLVRLATDGIFAFSTAPIRAAAILGALSVAFSCMFALYSLVAKLLQLQVPRGFTALTFLIVFTFGINLMFLGIIGEYVGRVYEELKSRPLYVVRTVVRGRKPAQVMSTAWAATATER